MQNIALLSRLYVSPEYRREGAIFPLFKGMFEHCYNENRTHVFCEIRNSISQMLSEYGFNFRRVSDYYKYHGVLRAVYFTDLQEFMDKLHDDFKELWCFMSDNGRIFPYTPKSASYLPAVTKRSLSESTSPSVSPIILTRDQLVKQYDQILERSGTTRKGSIFEHNGCPIPVIVQSTSGSRNAPLLIPRSAEDIEDIFSRVLRYYTVHFGCSPSKMGMIGGISHVNAAESIRMNGISIRHFTLDTLPELLVWQPEFVMCYPSTLRVLLEKFGNRLNFLQCIKTGGEKLFPADCMKTFSLLPSLLLIEQYGSTELPALALRSIHAKNFHSVEAQITVPFDLQIQRFTFLGKHQVGWHPVIARDNFTKLLFKMVDFYDTGDEALWSGAQVLDFRRKADLENKYWVDINCLLQSGVTNVQLDLSKRVIFYEGMPPSNPTYTIDGTLFTFQAKHLQRLRSSNKLPILMAESPLLEAVSIGADCPCTFNTQLGIRYQQHRELFTKLGVDVTPATKAATSRSPQSPASAMLPAFGTVVSGVGTVEGSSSSCAVASHIPSGNDPIALGDRKSKEVEVSEIKKLPPYPNRHRKPGD